MLHACICSSMYALPLAHMYVQSIAMTATRVSCRVSHPTSPRPQVQTGWYNPKSQVPQSPSPTPHPVFVFVTELSGVQTRPQSHCDTSLFHRPSGRTELWAGE